MNTTPLSKNCQTIYFGKEVLHDKGLEPQITDDGFFCNYVILKYSVFIFLDLKQMATTYFQPSQLLCVWR